MHVKSVIVCQCLYFPIPLKCNLAPDVSQRQSVDYNCLDAGVDRVLI